MSISTELQASLIDYEIEKESSPQAFIGLIKNNYNLAKYNRMDIIQFEVITGFNLKEAVDHFNEDHSHDNYIDFDFQSSIIISEEI